LFTKYTNVIAVCLFALTGCVTPPAIKQALVDLDKGYTENLTMMQQYRQLFQNIKERHHYWSRYVKQRLTLDLALRSITQDSWGGDAARVDDGAKQLGEKLQSEVNLLRLPGLAEQKGADGSVKFKAGDSANTAGKIVEHLPKIVNLIVEKVEEDYNAKGNTGDTNPFDVYRNNVSALHQINATIKRYLDIDVTVAPEDVSDIAKAIRQLQQ
jgi:hypothetical protein